MVVVSKDRLLTRAAQLDQSFTEPRAVRKRLIPQAVKSCTALCVVWYHVDMARKNPAAVSLGRKGGKNSRKNLKPEKRTELARKAAAARWAKAKAKGRSKGA